MTKSKLAALVFTLFSTPNLAISQQQPPKFFEEGDRLCLETKGPKTCYPKSLGEIKIIENGTVLLNPDASPLTPEQVRFTERLNLLFVRDIAFLTNKSRNSQSFLTIPVIYSVRWIGGGVNNGTLQVWAELRLSAPGLIPYVVVPEAFQDSKSIEKVARMVHFRSFSGEALDRETTRFLQVVVSPAIVRALLNDLVLLNSLLETATFGLDMPKR
ncbi:MAG: hypothetical protein IT289_09625 [Oligoflexia bacterium]|nr:hypothetical protein [Oligoflexia bacterium]